MKEINEMSLKELFEVQQQLGKAIHKRVQMGEDIRKRGEIRKRHPLIVVDLHVNEIKPFDDTFSVRLREDGCIDVIEHIVDEDVIEHIVDEIIKAKQQKEKLKISWIDLDTGEVEVKEMTYDEYKKEIGF